MNDPLSNVYGREVVYITSPAQTSKDKAPELSDKDRENILATFKGGGRDFVLLDPNATDGGNSILNQGVRITREGDKSRDATGSGKAAIVVNYITENKEIVYLLVTVPNARAAARYANTVIVNFEPGTFQYNAELTERAGLSSVGLETRVKQEEEWRQSNGSFIEETPSQVTIEGNTGIALPGGDPVEIPTGDTGTSPNFDFDNSLKIHLSKYTYTIIGSSNDQVPQSVINAALQSNVKGDVNRNFGNAGSVTLFFDVYPVAEDGVDLAKGSKVEISFSSANEANQFLLDQVRPSGGGRSQGLAFSLDHKTSELAGRTLEGVGIQADIENNPVMASFRNSANSFGGEVTTFQSTDALNEDFRHSLELNQLADETPPGQQRGIILYVNVAENSGSSGNNPDVPDSQIARVEFDSAEKASRFLHSLPGGGRIFSSGQPLVTLNTDLTGFAGLTADGIHLRAEGENYTAE